MDNGLSGAGVVFDNMNLESSPERPRPSRSAAARIAGSELLSTSAFQQEDKILEEKLTEM